MSDIISNEQIGSKENPIICKSLSDIKQLKTGIYYKYTCECLNTFVKIRIKNSKVDDFRISHCRICCCKHNNFIKYGTATTNPPVDKEKVRNTIIEHFGTWENYCRIKSEKRKNTNKLKYGDENYNNSEKMKKTKLANHGNANYVNPEKAAETRKLRYGSSNYRNNLKRAETNMKKYGNICSLNGSNREKVEKAIIEKYGSLEAFNCYRIQKSKEALVEKYGVNNPGLIHREDTSNRHIVTWNGIQFDSNWELWYYKYLLFNKVSFIYQPNIPLEYTYKDKTYYYFPDFLVENTLVEIKGDQFFENGKMINPFDRSQDDKYEAKHQCAIRNNVKFIRRKEIREIVKFLNKNNIDNISLRIV